MPKVADYSEIEKQLAPTAWTKRMSPDDVVKAHIQFIKGKTEIANETIKHESFQYGSNEMEILTIYGTDLPNGAYCYIFSFSFTFVYNCPVCRCTNFSLFTWWLLAAARLTFHRWLSGNAFLSSWI